MAPPETPARPSGPSRSSSISMTSPHPTDDSPQSHNPASSLLQDLLREKKAENRRRGIASDTDPRRVSIATSVLDDRTVQSSPIPPPSRGSGEAAHARHTSGFARDPPAPKVMGMREMEQHISKISKQNFDLKLELFHRRQRNDVLEAQLAKMEDIEKDNSELQSINEDLLKELERREAAVKEAVELICELEAKVEAMETKMTTPALDPAVSMPPPSLPLRHQAISTTSNPQASQTPNEDPRERDLSPVKAETPFPPPTKSARRPPSFLRDDKPSTSALRSLYKSESYLSLNRAGSPQRDPDPDTFTLNSPRLSILSESSFVSVYGKSPKTTLGPPQDLDIPCTSEDTEYKGPTNRPNYAFSRCTSNTSIEKPNRQIRRGASVWSSDGGSQRRSEKSFSSRVEAMTKFKSRSSSNSRNEHLSKWLDEPVSGDDDSPLRHRNIRQQSPKPRRSSPKPASNDQFSSIGEVLHNKPHPNSLEPIPALPALTKPVFAGPEILPPTPDTMSTAQKASSSTQSIITEKSLNDISRARKALDPPILDTHHYTTTSSLGLDFEHDIEDSDEEQQSVRMQQSEADSSVVPPDAFDSFPFMGTGTSSKAMRMMGDNTPSRPPLATNVMSDGDGYASRALSYPSPKSDGRRNSIATTPTRPQPARGETMQSPLSPKEWMSNDTTTSPSSQPKHAQKTSIAPSHASSGMETSSATIDTTPESKIPKTTSSRLKTFFRRSNSHSSHVMLGMQQQQNSGNNAVTVERESKIARPGTSSAGSGLGRSASGRVFGGRRV